jgi:hypothetical protein
MAIGEQLNVRPTFKTDKLPCEAEAGDLVVLTTLAEGETDTSAQGLASLWFCTKGSDRERVAVWRRVDFDGIATCEQPVPAPPQNDPELRRG